MWRLSKGGGVPIVVRSIINEVDQDRVKLHAVTLRPLFAEDELSGLSDRVCLSGLDHEGRVRPFTRLTVLVQVARRLRQIRPEVVHTHTGTAWMAIVARIVLPRARFLLEVHDGPGSGRHGRATDRFEGLLARRFGFRPVCHSTSVQSDVESIWRVPKNRSIYFPLGIDTNFFGSRSVHKQQWRADNGLPINRVVVLYVARLVPTKNVPLLMDAAEIILRNESTNKPVFIVIAEGSERPFLSAEIERRELRSDFFLLSGRYGAELADAYTASDLFCSTSDYEGFGLAVVEAMASGLPVVATDVGGHHDLIIHDKTGLLVKRGDARAVATAITALVNDRQEAVRMGNAGQKRARSLFDVKTMAKSFMDLYASADSS